MASRQDNLEVLKLALQGDVHFLASFLEGGLLEADRYVAVALLAVKRKPSLLDCSVESLRASVALSAALGILPGFGAHLTVERDGEAPEALLVPGYQAFVQVLYAHAGVSVEARVVYERDFFRLKYAPLVVIKHRPLRQGDPGPVIGAYAIARSEGGEPRVEVLLKARDIDPIAPGSDESPDSARGMNQHDYVEWLKGVAVKRLAKWSQRTPEIGALIALERASEKGKTRPRSIDVLESLGVELPSVKPAVFFEVTDAPAIVSEKAEARVKSSRPGQQPKTRNRCCSCGNADMSTAFAEAAILAQNDKGCGRSGVRHWLCGPCEIQHKKSLKEKRNASIPGEAASPATTIPVPLAASPPPGGVAKVEGSGGAGQAIVSAPVSPEPPLSREIVSASGALAVAAPTSADSASAPMRDPGPQTAATAPSTVTLDASAAPAKPFPWARITKDDVLAVVDISFPGCELAAERLASVLNKGGDEYDAVLPQVQAMIVPRRGKKAVYRALSAARAMWVQGEGAGERAEQLPLTANQFREFWRALVGPSAPVPNTL